MVSYLILRTVLVGVLIIGLVYGFISDMVDSFIPGYSTGMMAGYNTIEAQWGYDALIFMFQIFLVPALLSLILFSYNMSQKPGSAWGFFSEIGVLIISIVALAALIITYSFAMPFIDYLVSFTTMNGAPAATALFLAKAAMWFFVIMGAIMVILPFIYNYKMEYDQGATSGRLR